jgi:hypothetical protein
MKTAMMILLWAATAAWAQDAPQTTCTNASLKGDYGFTLTGTRPSAPTPGAAIETVIGTAMTHFDGNGNLTQIDNIHGSVTGFHRPSTDRQCLSHSHRQKWRYSSIELCES